MCGRHLGLSVLAILALRLGLIYADTRSDPCSPPEFGFHRRPVVLTPAVVDDLVRFVGHSDLFQGETRAVLDFFKRKGNSGVVLLWPTFGTCAPRQADLLVGY